MQTVFTLITVFAAAAIGQQAGIATAENPSESDCPKVYQVGWLREPDEQIGP